MESILKDIYKQCCSDNCARSLTFQDVSKQRRRVSSKPPEQKLYFTAIIELGRNSCKGGKGQSEKKITFNWDNVCAMAWCAVQGISRTWQAKNKKDRYFNDT